MTTDEGQMRGKREIEGREKRERREERKKKQRGMHGSFVTGKNNTKQQNNNNKIKQQNQEEVFSQIITRCNSWERDSALACAWAVTDSVICDS